MRFSEANMKNIVQEYLRKKEKKENEWYNLRPMLGYYNWALFYILLGGREVGKSYSVTNFFVDQFIKNGTPFTWLRLTETAAQKLLTNNAEKLVDPDIRRKYNLNLKTRGNNVYNVEYEERIVKHKDGSESIKMVEVKRTLMARVYCLSTFYNDKGSIFDKDYLKFFKNYNVAIDEFEREKGEKKTFDILYSLVNQLENLLRSTKDHVRIFFLGNTLEEASDILCAFNFIPEKWGIFKLKSKRAVIQNIEPSEAYKQRRKGTIADILLPTASTFTNKIDTDKTLIYKGRLIEPNEVIKFTKDPNDWFTVWDGNIIKKYAGEKKPVTAMRPYLDELYSPDNQKTVITLFDTRSYNFVNLITFKQFQNNLELLKPRK